MRAQIVSRATAFGIACSLLVACGGTQEPVEEKAVPSTSRISAPESTTRISAAESTTSLSSAASGPETQICTGGEDTRLYLTSVDVEDGAVGHPDGAKTLVYHYVGDPEYGLVTFGATADGVVRIVKFIDGAKSSNSYMDLSGTGVNQEIHAPAIPENGELRVAIPAAVGERFNGNWSATLEVEGQTVSTCGAF